MVVKTAMEATVNRQRPIFWLVLLLLGGWPLGANAKTYALVVNGLGGDQTYLESFRDSATTFMHALETLDSGQNIVRLDESATRQNILDSIDAQAALMVGDTAAVFVLMLVGHGTADTDTWRFNIKGPDLTTEDLVAALNGLPSGRQLVVLATSASGAALEALTQPQRVVVTATKSGGEINAVRFPEFLAEAMGAVKTGANNATTADYDRNEILTIAEAFRYANAQTIAYYEQQKLLASEHARLRGDNATDIAIALLGSLKDAKDDPVVATLLEKRLALENDFQQLTSQKENMSVTDYYDELETLLIAIAKLQQTIDVATGWSESDAES